MTDDELGAVFNEACQARPSAGRYRSYKGGEYMVVNIIAIREHDLVPCIFYQSLTTGICFFRPLSEFTEPITLPDGTTVPRFTRVEP